jgi:catechol 2,3-dioxygenase
MTDPNTRSVTTRIGRVALHVNDLDRVVDFYREVVGLSLLDHNETRATLGAGETPLLELCSAPDRPERRSDETGLFHTAFLVPSRAALGDALSRIRKHWDFDGASDHLVSEALYLSDPEGNGIEIYRDRPKKEWPIKGDRVGIDTLPLDVAEIASLETGKKTVPKETTIGHVHLEVASLSRAREFYVERLGMNVRQSDGNSVLFIAAGEYHHHLGLNTWNGRSGPGEGRGLAWFELVVPDADTISATSERLAESVVRRPSTDSVVLTDSDGIELRVRIDSN